MKTLVCVLILIQSFHFTMASQSNDLVQLYIKLYDKVVENINSDYCMQRVSHQPPWKIQTNSRSAIDLNCWPVNMHSMVKRILEVSERCMYPLQDLTDLYTSLVPFINNPNANNLIQPASHNNIITLLGNQQVQQMFTSGIKVMANQHPANNKQATIP